MTSYITLMLPLTLALSVGFGEDALHHRASSGEENIVETHLNDSEAELKLDNMKFLFSLSAINGEITANDGYIETVEIPKKSVNQLIMFSDRPDRFSREIELNMLEKIWHSQDTDSFDQDPPNAVIHYEMKSDIVTHIVELVGFELREEHVIFNIERTDFPTKGNSGSITDLLIVIDDVGEDILHGFVESLPLIMEL